MRILIASDSHRVDKNIIAAIKKEHPDMLIHLGDVEGSDEIIAKEAGEPYTPCIFIKGNCDRWNTYSDNLRDKAIFEEKGHKFYCCHGHNEMVNYSLSGVCIEAVCSECDIVLFGHTHVPFDSENLAVNSYNSYYNKAESSLSEGIRILNPGSISLPRGGSSCGYMIMDMKDSGEYKVTYKTI